MPPDREIVDEPTDDLSFWVGVRTVVIIILVLAATVIFLYFL